MPKRELPITEGVMFTEEEHQNYLREYVEEANAKIKSQTIKAKLGNVEIEIPPGCGCRIETGTKWK